MKVLDNYKCEGQMSMFDLYDLDTWYGKTSLERSHLRDETKRGKTLDAYLKKFAELRIKPPLYLCLRKDGRIAAASWETGGALLGEYTIASFGESPRDAVESRLSQILEDHPHPKYYLSAKACQGILTRANRRGKKLPREMEQALLNQIALLTPSRCEGDVKLTVSGNELEKAP